MSQQSNPIIVEHLCDKDGNPYWLETTDETHCNTKMDYQYPMAFHRPNYPVPAISIVARIYPEGVVIRERHNLKRYILLESNHSWLANH